MINVYETAKEIDVNKDFKDKNKTGRIVLANAFSVNMLKADGYLFFAKIDLPIVKYLISESKDFLSVIGHQSTANLLSAKLGIDVEVNRINYIKQHYDQIIVCLPTQRLEEGKILSLEELNKIDVKFRLVK